MVKKHFQRNLVIAIIGAIAIGIGIFYFPQLQQVQLQANEIFATIPADTLPQLSITGYVREDMTCYVKTSLIIEYTNGRKALVSSSPFVGGGAGVAPVALELINRNTQEEIRNFIVEGRVRCDMDNVAQDGNPTSNKSTMYGWTLYPSLVTLGLGTTNLDGKGIDINPITKTISQLGLRDNEEFIFVTFAVPASQIDALYSQHTQQYQTEIRTFLAGSLKFAFNTLPTQQYQIVFPFGSLYNHWIYNVNKIAPTTTTPLLTNELIEINSIVRSTDLLRLDSGINKLDTSNIQGRQVKVTGTIRTWDQAQGNPTIKITFGGATVRQGTMTFDHTENENRNGVFVFLHQFEQNTVEGEYKFLMEKAGRTTTSTRTIIIQNTVPVVNSDKDGDGIADAFDNCPLIVGVASNNGCPPPTTPPPTTPDEQTVINKMLQGKIQNFATVIFKDGTRNSFIVQDAGFLSGVGTVTPLQVTSQVDGQKKILDRIEYEVFYTYTNSADAIATSLELTNVRFTPTVIVSSVQEKSGTSIEQTGATLTNGGAIQREGQGFVGVSLGKGLVRAVEFQSLTTEFITQGQAREVQALKITASGDFVLKRESITHKFILKDAFVSFPKFTIENTPDVMGEPDCQVLGLVAEYDEGTGKFVRCVEPPITQGDEDNDGVPDSSDKCLGVKEDGQGDNPNDGCPFGKGGEGCPDDESAQTAICDGDGTGGNPDGGGLTCSSSNPQLCNPPPIDLTTILTVGGIFFVAIAVVILVMRRR